MKNLEILNRKKETQLTKIDDLFCLLGSYFVESTISHMWGMALLTINFVSFPYEEVFKKQLNKFCMKVVKFSFAFFGFVSFNVLLSSNLNWSVFIIWVGGCECVQLHVFGGISKNLSCSLVLYLCGSSIIQFNLTIFLQLILWFWLFWLRSFTRGVSSVFCTFFFPSISCL